MNEATIKILDNTSNKVQETFNYRDGNEKAIHKYSLKSARDQWTLVKHIICTASTHQLTSRDPNPAPHIIRKMHAQMDGNNGRRLQLECQWKLQTQ